MLICFIIHSFQCLSLEDSDESEETEQRVFSGDRRASLDGNAQQWKELMLNAISEREKAEHDKQVGSLCSLFITCCYDEETVFAAYFHSGLSPVGTTAE